ncbi:hypothetical protein RHA02_000571 [Vibrio cholerae]|nr:hypothetical protein [Vibrio cholerae]ELB8600892.1 hypothetical protein [Vibrio cholerae]
MTKLPHLQLSVVEAQPKTHPANAWPMSMSFPQRCQDRVLMPPYRSAFPTVVLVVYINQAQQQPSPTLH